MDVGIQVEGLDEALTRLDREIKQIKNASNAGLWEAGIKIIRASQKRLRASVVTGNLRASAYVRNAMKKQRPAPDKLTVENQPIPGDKIPEIGVELGFTANYALYAHEDIEHNRAPKFLENVIIENENLIVEIIKRRSKADG